MREIINPIVTSGPLQIKVVSSRGSFSSIGKVKSASNDGCGGTADSVMFRNQSCPHCPFPFLQPSRPIKAHIQLYPHARPHPSDEYK
ncbi:unnamed protein product [Hymenolepis diminuta]|uniref:Uncharacterized protein n=1 Tax=Hymenolepis diminuta TaxID=6216 RepID=A0A564YJ68_HYMDI|nr:unnamed protein product [Hymenolepis diminuta]